MVANPASSEPYIGKLLTDSSFTVDQGVLDAYYQGLDLTPGDGSLIPSSVLSRPDNEYILESGYSNRFGHLWVRQAWALFKPLQRDIHYQVRGEIRDIYQRRDRNVVQYQTSILAPDGELVARSQHHQSFLRETNTGGEVRLRDPNAKPAARGFEIPAGERFGGLERRITVEMCGRFFHGKSNYHTDLEASKALGFKEIVIGGRMTMAYAVHTLEQHFGRAFQASGRIDVKFTNPLWANETIIARGVVTGPLADEPDRVGAFVWVAKPDGTVVLVGNASVAAQQS
ncbi:MAG: MaoC family dehydratase [Gammaproteobacteria bacterium]|nr:MaoC family dehydratase [Gammaproteobacteria bacterium]